MYVVTHVPVHVREALTGFDAEGLDFGAHVIGSVTHSTEVRGDFDRHRALSPVLACLIHHFMPVLQGHKHSVLMAFRYLHH